MSEMAQARTRLLRAAVTQGHVWGPISQNAGGFTSTCKRCSRGWVSGPTEHEIEVTPCWGLRSTAAAGLACVVPGCRRQATHTVSWNHRPTGRAEAVHACEPCGRKLLYGARRSKNFRTPSMTPVSPQRQKAGVMTSDDIPSEYGYRTFYKPNSVDPEHSSDAGEVHILDADKAANKRHNVMVIDAHGNSQWPIRYDNGDLGWDNPEAIVTPRHIVHKAFDHAKMLDYQQGLSGDVPATHRDDLDRLSDEMGEHLKERGYGTAEDWLKDNPHGPTHLSRKEHHMAGTRKIAHDSGDGETIYHCPFCGSGQVIARSDRTIECEFCHTAFTVQVQPELSAFPQTVNGAPVQVPGMPGEIGGEAPDQPGDMSAEPMNPDDLADDDSDNPFASDDDQQDDEQDGDDPMSPDDLSDEDDEDQAPQSGGGFAGKPSGANQPPWLKNNPTKRSSLHTLSGAQVDEADMVRRLALRHADDRSQTLDAVRGSR